MPLFLWYGIVAGSAQGVAAQQPAERQPAAFEGTVFAQRLQGILRAGRGEPAGRGLQGGDADLVESNEQDQRVRRYLAQGAQPGSGGCP